jgi:DNA polymerase elongation subunit (family B)
MSDFYTHVSVYGNKLLYRGIRNGTPIVEKLDFSPTLYVTGKETSKFKTLFGHPVDPVKFTDIKEAKDFIKRYDSVHGFEISGQTNFAYAYIAETFLGEIQYDISKMHICTLDIETEKEGKRFADIATANEAINLISMHDKVTGQVNTFGCWDYIPKKANVKYWNCKDEKSMLRTFINFWASSYPDILTGWNCESFDIVYLANRIKRELDETYVKKLSPFGLIYDKSIIINGKDVPTYDIVGITVLDYLNLYKKFGQKKLEQYTLDVVCEEELGEKKLELPGLTWKENYAPQNQEIFTTYNIRDVELVSKLDDKLKLIDLILGMTYMTKANIRDLLGTVKYWDTFIYNYLLTKDVIIPSEQHNERVDFSGGYVKDPKPGMYGWISSYDYDSMYPHEIMTLNLSPETYVAGERLPLSPADFLNPTPETLAMLKDAKDRGYAVACNGTMYHRDKRGFLPEMMDMLYTSRKNTKQEMLILQSEEQNIIKRLSELKNQ